MALLPLTGTALAQEDVADPEDACPENPPPAPYTDREDIPDVHLALQDGDIVADLTDGQVGGFASKTWVPALAP